MAPWPSIIKYAAILTVFSASVIHGQVQPPRNLIQQNVVDPNAPVQENIRRIQDSIMYPYEQYPVTNIADMIALVQFNLRFPLPFYGFYFNYTWVSLHGHIAFSQSPPSTQRPLKLPIDDWPVKPDPSFIGPFHMEAAIGEKVDANDLDPGVYVRIIPDVGSASGTAPAPGWTTNQQRNEESAIKTALTMDIQSGIIGAEYFTPKHVMIITWRNVTFNGGSSGTKTITNTFQVVIATDEILTYCMFNYEQMKWTSATNSGGGPGDGLGGIPAFVGFNAGNGTRAYEYMPYSQNARITNLVYNGQVNGKSGRHVFRIDEEIYSGVCNYEPGMSSPQLFLSPQAGNMLGGVLVNMTGPCFSVNQRIKAKFKDVEVTCQYRDRNHATCLTPRIFYIGYIDVFLTIGDGAFQFRNQFYLEPPDEAKEVVYIRNREDVHVLDPLSLSVEWATGNLTYNQGAPVTISLWAYRETGPMPEIVFVDTLVESVPNKGTYIISPLDFTERNNWDTRDIGFGFLQVNLTNPSAEGLTDTPTLWSRPLPLGWYFKPQWGRYDGPEWARMKCDNWMQREDRLNTFANAVNRCPCTLNQALSDKGRFGPDPSCDMNMNTGCYLHREAKHCVRSGVPNFDGNGQQCCYDNDNYLILTADTPFGGSPARSHPFGGFPYFDTGKVPSLSHWVNDLMAYYFCCRWQDPETEGCWAYRKFRSSQDCAGYQSPNASAVFGDPHYITFDNLEYTFNGLGEYVLVRVNNRANQIDIQGRFTQVVDEKRAVRLRASELTSVSMKDNVSSTVEVQLRNIEARWRYRLDVLVDHNRVYFDRPHQKVQAFRGVTVYVPGNIHNQSNVIIQFQSGAGVEVVESMGHMTCRVLLPRSFMNSTRGLMGNWSGTQDDDFTTPLGDIPVSPQSAQTNFDAIHRLFGLKWVVKDSEDPDRPVGKSLFFHEFGRSSNTYYNETFQPVMDRRPTIYSNTTLTPDVVNRVCSLSYQCYFDYVITGNRDFATSTRYSEDSLKTLKSDGLRPLITCGALWTPRHGHKSSRQYIIGTRVKFFCEPGFMLVGEVYRDCYATGEWSYADKGETECIDEMVYNARNAGLTVGIVFGSLAVLTLAVVLLFHSTAYGLKRYDGVYHTDEAVYNARRAGVTSGIALGIIVPLVVIGACVIAFLLGQKRKTEENFLKHRERTSGMTELKELKSKDLEDDQVKAKLTSED